MVERDAHLVRRLERHFAGAPATVVHGDLLRVPLPRRRYSVVASIPLGTTAALLHRLLDDPGAPDRLELLIEWGTARRLATARLRDLATAWWAARFELRLCRRVPAACFRPPPRIDAARLPIRPRTLAGHAGSQRLLRSMLRAGFTHPAIPLLTIAAGTPAGAARSHRALRRLVTAAGIDPTTPAATATQWHDLALGLLGGAAPPQRHAVAGSHHLRGRGLGRLHQCLAGAYAHRSGVEGSRRSDLHHARYRGLAKTHLQHVLTALALNLVRVDAWLTGTPLGGSWVSRLAVLQSSAQHHRLRKFASRVGNRVNSSVRPARRLTQALQPSRHCCAWPPRRVASWLSWRCAGGVTLVGVGA